MQDQRNNNDENLANQMEPVPASYPVTGVDGGLPQLTGPLPNQTLDRGFGTAYPPQYQVEQNFQITDGTNQYHYNSQDLGALLAAPLTTDLYHGNGLPAQTVPNGAIQTPGLNYSNTGNSGALTAAPLPANIGYGNGPLAQTGSYGVGHSLGSYHYDSQNLGALSAAPLATDLFNENGLTAQTGLNGMNHTPASYHFNAQDLGSLSAAPLATDINYGNGFTAPDGPNETTQYSGLSYLNVPETGTSSVTPLSTNFDYGNGSTAQSYPNEFFPGGQSFWNPGMQPLSMVPAMNGTLSSNGMAAGCYEAPTILPTPQFMTAHPHGGMYADDYNPMVQCTTGHADWNPSTQPPVGASTYLNYGTNFATYTPLASAAPAVAGNRRFPCTQPNCNQTFGRNYELIRHEGSVHGINAGTHLCQVAGCPKAQGSGYSRADKLTEHMWKVHRSMGYFKRV